MEGEGREDGKEEEGDKQWKGTEEETGLPREKQTGE